MLDFSNLTSLWGSLIVEECVRNGCDYFCVSPGSRSTPLTVAVARNPRAKKIICYDERGAAFHALGYARATGKAAVLICSSGTASANYLPALIEADVDGVPMVVLSTDRPPELRDTMANQTIVQPGMFGRYVRFFFDMPVPTEAIAPSMPLTTVGQALHRAHAEHGPVHINCMFREPLAPGPGEISAEYRARITRYQGSRKPFTQYATYNKALPDQAAVYDIPFRLDTNGIVIVGQLKSDKEAAAVRAFTSRLNWPVLPDITSQLRLGSTSPNIIHNFDQILLSDERILLPNTVIQIGGQFLSKRLLQLLSRAKPMIWVVINDRSTRFDPNHLVTHRFELSAETLTTLADHWSNSSGDSYDRVMFDPGEGRGQRVTLAQVSEWNVPHMQKPWRQRQALVEPVFEEELKIESGKLKIENEGMIARVISEEISEAHALFIGNSMPIRDVDMYAVADGNHVPVAANRGASGIDGNLATALGFAVGHERPTTLLVGDLTLLHDLNSLSLLRYVRQPITIVVINNSGGGIFHMLPIREFEDVFEENFGTPHGFYFEHAAKMFGVAWFRPKSLPEFRTAYQDAIAGNQHTIIELQTDREINLASHKALSEKIKAALAAA